MRGFDEDVAPSSNTMSHVLGNQRRYGNSIRGDGPSLDASHKMERRLRRSKRKLKD